MRLDPNIKRKAKLIMKAKKRVRYEVKVIYTTDRKLTKIPLVTKIHGRNKVSMKSGNLFIVNPLI